MSVRDIFCNNFLTTILSILFKGEQSEVTRGQVICPKFQLLREDLGLESKSLRKESSSSNFGPKAPQQLLECESNWLFRSVLASVIYLWQRHFASLCI